MSLLSLPATLRQVVLREVALDKSPLEITRYYNGLQAQPYVLRAGLLLANQQLYEEYLATIMELVSESVELSYKALVVNVSSIDISSLINFTSWCSRMTRSTSNATLQLHIRLLMTHTERVEGPSLDRWLNYCRKTGLQATYTFECLVEDPQQTEHNYTTADVQSQDDHELVKLYTAILEWSVRQCNFMAEQAQQTFAERSALFQAMVRTGSQQTVASLIQGSQPPCLRSYFGILGKREEGSRSTRLLRTRRLLRWTKRSG